MYRVFSISHNVRLLLARNDVLALAGFSVVSPKSPEQAPLLAAHEAVDAVVVGHSIGGRLRKELITELRHQCPNCLVCFVYEAPDTAREPMADASLDVTEGPEPLIRFLQDRLPKNDAIASYRYHPSPVLLRIPVRRRIVTASATPQRRTLSPVGLTLPLESVSPN